LIDYCISLLNRFVFRILITIFATGFTLSLDTRLNELSPPAH